MWLWNRLFARCLCPLPQRHPPCASEFGCCIGKMGCCLGKKEELPPAVRINPLTDLFDEFTPMVGMLFDDFKKCARRVSMLAAMSPSSRGSSKKSINAGAIAPELKAMAEASKRRTT